MNTLYTLSTPETLKRLSTNEHGLSIKEAEKRLAHIGPNEIQDEKKWTLLFLLGTQFWNSMVGILALGMGVSFWTGEVLDAYAIGAIILLNAGIGFFQEYRAEKAVDALKKMTAPFALVSRGGMLQKIPARELVPGDLIILEEGAQVPADARLVETVQLFTMEASLTGESNPIEKQTSVPKKTESLGDFTHLVFMGTTVNQGHGKAVVIQTGMQTEFGKIANLVRSQKDDPTPLQKQLTQLTRFLGALVLIIIFVLLFLALVSGREFFEMLLLSISLAVSVIPEGLPAVITLTLALGVQRIAGQKAIIRKLSAAETLGSTSVICTDKTGTLTQNQMTVCHSYLNGTWEAVEGIGYAPFPTFKPEKNAELLLQAAALCNNSTLFHNKDQWEIAGDPTEGALLVWAQKGGVDLEKLKKEWLRKDELIFDSTRKRMSTVNKDRLFCKGAPDSLLEVCTHILENGKTKPLTPAIKKHILSENEAMAKQAFRILGLATKVLKKGEGAKEEGLVFLGLVALMDPPRVEVKEAIETCKRAHIRVVMITGDHALTAQAVGEEIGLYRKGDRVVTGKELEEMSLFELKKIINKVSIFARVSPEHKVKILEALQAQGHIVAMTGDGVNDAPALKRADIGVAMGITGTDVSKEASDIILMDDNFATIVATIKEGRVIYRNIKKFIRFLLSANFDEIIVVSFIFLIGGPIPFLPLQILWVNLLTDALPAIALGVDSGEHDIMDLKPRSSKAKLWKDLMGYSTLAGVLSAGVSFYLYFTQQTGHSLEHLRTLLITTIVVFELALVFSVRFTEKSMFHHFFKNKLLLLGVASSLGVQLLAVYTPFLQDILKTEALSGQDWLHIIVPCTLAILILEAWKKTRVHSDTV